MLPNIKQLNLEIVGGCNYECAFCPQANHGRELGFRKVLPVALAKKIVQEVGQYGVKSIALHGSGEPTLHKHLPEIVAFVRSQGHPVSITTNGSRLSPELFLELSRAGLTSVTVSITGYNPALYHQWMGVDCFEDIINNIQNCLELKRQFNLETTIETRHLIIDSNNVDFEIAEYRKNIIAPLGGICTEIWLMHNWLGPATITCDRSKMTTKPQRTCGRPFAPQLEVRAGGVGSRHAAVVPCSFVLGKDSEAVLGYLDNQTIAEVLNDGPFRLLQEAHLRGDFDSIPYCKGCDQLMDVPESLVWTNIPGRKYGKGRGIQDLTFTKDEKD